MTRGEKLRKLRKENGNKTQKEVLADLEKMGKSLDKNTLSKAENDANISNTTLEILASYYNVSLDYLKLDSVENSTNENIDINKILKLNDDAIRNLKSVDEEYIDILNEFLSDFNLNIFLKNLKDLKKAKIKYKKLREIYRIYELKELIKYYSENNMQIELKEVFKYFEQIIDEFETVTTNTINSESGEVIEEIYIEDSDARDLAHEINDLKKRYLLRIKEEKHFFENEEMIIKVGDFEDLKELYKYLLKKINSNIGLPKYLTSNSLDYYLNTLEGFNSMKELTNSEKTEKMKEYLKIQNDLIENNKK